MEQFNRLEKMLAAIKRLEDLIINERIFILKLSLMKIGYTEEDAIDLINEKALELLESNNGELKYNKLEDSCFNEIFFKREETSHEMLEDRVYTLKHKERYEIIFTEAFDSLDYEHQGAIIEMLLRPEEENDYNVYLEAVNQLVATIFEEDEDLAKLVQKKLLNQKDKTKTK